MAGSGNPSNACETVFGRAPEGLVAIHAAWYGRPMASLAQYSARLHDLDEPARRVPGLAARCFGIALYTAIGVLVVAAAMQSA